MRARFAAWILGPVAAAAGCVSQKPTPYRAAALEAASWLRGTAVTSETGCGWRADPARSESPVASGLYSGGAGVVLFLLEAYRATAREDWLELARSGADHLVQSLPERAAGTDASLYTGIAGVGFVLERAFEVTGDESYRMAARGCADLLHECARTHGDGVDWNDTTDIIRGGAGIGLFLLQAGERWNDPKAIDLAARAGRRLLGMSEEADGGRKWPMTKRYPRLMPNFSHGTAGVCFFLARLYGVTKERAFLDAALAGARYLTANNRGGDGCLVMHHEPGGEDLFYLGWCHGPTGTARLFYELHRVTGDRVWFAWTERCAASLLDSGIPERRTPGFWNNAGVCCGSAGVAELFVDLYGVTGEQRYLAFARKMAEDVLARSDQSEKGRRWVHAEHRVRPDLLQAQTGYMQGAAGIGTVLLKLDAAIRGLPWTLRMPDSPF